MIHRSRKFRALRWTALACAVLIAAPLALSSQALQSQEDEVQKLLTQADGYSQKGDYKLAIGCYLEAAALAQSKPNLSRSYFGLALSYFYLRDMANSVKWMRKVSEVDPNKEVSELFYPKGFAQLFNQVQKERREKTLAAGGEEAVQKKDQEKVGGEQKPVKQDIKQEEAPPEVIVKPPAKQPASQLENTVPARETKGGHWEIGAHYSMWGIDLIKGIFEGSLTDKLGEDVQKKVVDLIQDAHSSVTKSDYSQALSFDSSGSNYGLEVRYYAKGRAGTFSFGLSFEKTHIRLAVTGTAKQDFTNGSYASANADAYIDTNPLTTNFSFRWDFNSGRVVTPYFVLGLGFSSLEGEVKRAYSWEYQLGSNKESFEYSKLQTFEELAKDPDINFDLPKMFVLLQMNFGIRAEVYPGLFIVGEAGIWDGLILRFGAAYRF